MIKNYESWYPQKLLLDFDYQENSNWIFKRWYVLNAIQKLKNIKERHAITRVRVSRNKYELAIKLRNIYENEIRLKITGQISRPSEKFALARGYLQHIKRNFIIWCCIWMISWKYLEAENKPGCAEKAPILSRQKWQGSTLFRNFPSPQTKMNLAFRILLCRSIIGEFWAQPGLFSASNYI